MNLKNTLSPVCLFLFFLGGLCYAQDPAHDHGAHGHSHGDERAIAFTVWIDAFEIFAEHPFVVVGTPAPFVTHVTKLKTFSPRTRGAVTFVMTLGSQRIEHQDPAPQRNGIYIPELVFPRPGKWSVTLQIPMDGKTYDVPFPPVQVYKTQADADHAPDPVETEGFSFLKEQQWIIPFQVEQVTSRTQNGITYRAVPESALAYSGDAAYLYVQLGGETFERRRVQVDVREQGTALVSLGLNEQEHVVTLGVGSVVLAHGEPAGQSTGDVVHVTDEQIQRFQIACQEAVLGGVDAWIQAPGQIQINHERMAHIVPRVKGVVSQVQADIGQHVKSGQVLAVIESRDLADAKAEFLSALERQELARTQFEREERLFQQKVTSEQDYQSSKQDFAKANIEHRAARQKLIALGLTKQEVDDLPAQPEEAFTSYIMIAPFDGTIIRKHIVLGEVVDDTSETFVIADLSTVWVDLNVNQKDIESIQIGQPAEMFRDHNMSGIRSQVSYVDQVLDPTTRTAVVRMELDNTEGCYRPGTFVTGRIDIQSRDQEIIVPADAIQIVNDKPCVFVKTNEGFALRYVTTGQKDTDRVEILSGVENGEQIVIHNAFYLKAELAKQAVSGHGHVH
ncbi:MAG: efflux RND transporter periplasmic adaptor subunit [Phycisphaerales bacterium]|nr:MAG: efflux RND transporter periplasmic adaptor subunit [Phycisphaerales bacterium]